MAADLGVSALIILIIAGAAYGAISLWIFRRFTASDALSQNTDRVVAHLLEFRLFLDEPPVIMQAQRELFFANLRLLRCIAPALLTLLVPSAIFLMGAESIFSHAPLRVGEAAVVTMQTRAASASQQASLQVPMGLTVETPAVRIPNSAEICWRVRALRPLTGRLIAHAENRDVGVAIRCATGLIFEIPFSPIRIEYPAATVLGAPWFIWFGIASIAGAAVRAA